jgi:leucyl aminopeptidase
MVIAPATLGNAHIPGPSRPWCSSFDDNSAMRAPTKSSPIGWSSLPLPDTDSDLLIVPWFEGERPEAIPGLDEASAGELARAVASQEFVAKPFDVFVAPLVAGSWRPRRAMLIGGGPRDAFGPTVARRLATAAALTARQRRTARAAFVARAAVESAGISQMEVLGQAIAEGLTLGEFVGATYKTRDPAPAAVPVWTIVAPGAAAGFGDAVERGRVMGESSNRARDLANEPGNVLTPREFASRVADVAREGGIAVQVLDEPQIEALKMGLLLGVARGSAEPPRVVVLRYEPPGAPAGPVLGLVGKGITFDTGGISIKPAEGMERMKDDMAGGAAVAGAMRAIGLLGAPIRVIGVIPMAENMPGGRAVKPGDILTSAEGKTVEVVNTDAEGRLILGDGLWYARQLGATHLINVATLTGAIVVALGKVASGIFGTPDAWVQQIRQFGDAAGDLLWPMPLFDDYREQLKSEIADFSNTGGRPAGSITAALFLKEFSGGLPWAHLDIAGTAWAEEARPYLPKGPSGVAVRTLAGLACGAAAWMGRI